MCALSTSNVFSDEPDKNLHDKCLYPTVIIEKAAFLNGKYLGSIGTGSGVIVRSEKIGDYYRNVAITCDHVVDVEKLKPIVMRRFGSERFMPNFRMIVRSPIYKDWSEVTGHDLYLSDVYATSVNSDIAILIFLSNKQMQVADIEVEKKFYFGSDVFKIGGGLGDSLRLDYGKITSVNSKKFGEDGMSGGSIRISAYTVQGDSGGPVFNKDRKLIGIMSFIRMHGTMQFNCMAFMQPLRRLEKWSKDNKNFLEFSYSKNAKLPELAFRKLIAKKFIVPKKPLNYWEKEVAIKHKAVGAKIYASPMLQFLQ